MTFSNGRGHSLRTACTEHHGKADSKGDYTAARWKLLLLLLMDHVIGARQSQRGTVGIHNKRIAVLQVD